MHELLEALRALAVPGDVGGLAHDLDRVGAGLVDIQAQAGLGIVATQLKVVGLPVFSVGRFEAETPRDVTSNHRPVLPSAQYLKMTPLRGFPPPPYRIARRLLVGNGIIVAVCASLGLLCCKLFASSVLDELRELRHVQEIWDEGGPEVEAVVQGTVRTRTFLSNFELDVRFLDPQDPSRNNFFDFRDIAWNARSPAEMRAMAERPRVRREIVKFSATVGPEPPTRDTVRLSLRKPGEFALGFMIQSADNRRNSAVMVIIAGVLLCGVLGLGVVFGLRRIRWFKAVATRGMVVRCPLVGVTEKPQLRCVEFAFEVPKSQSAVVEVRHQMGIKDPPPWLLGKGRYIVALVLEERSKQSWPLRKDYWPLLLDDEQRAAATSAIAEEDARLAQAQS